jgi:acyl-CoA thioesterase
MTNHEAMTLASDCAQAMFPVTAPAGPGHRLLSAGPGCARLA